MNAGSRSCARRTNQADHHKHRWKCSKVHFPPLNQVRLVCQHTLANMCRHSSSVTKGIRHRDVRPG